MSRTLIDCSGWLSICVFFLLAAVDAQGATIVVPKGSTEEELRAAAELGRIWLKGMGETAVVRSEDVPAAPAEKGARFYIGETELARALAPLPADLDADGFRVMTLSGCRVILRAASGFGTILAADWYAQNAMGVRWFVPGPLGEVVPKLSKWSPPALDRVVAPAFVSREFTGLDREGEEWARRNGMHGRLPHQHAMTGIFPLGLFDEHPEWFPLLDGRRYRPASFNDYNWQPNLALPQVAAYAAEAANAYFDSSPDAKGISVSINDSIRFDQSETTVRARGPLRWFRGRPDYSDVVFGFMNRVADDVGRRHPGKLLSAYAYYWCENAPSFPVRANVVPWLTADRSQWYDGRFRKEDRALIERWCRSGARILGMYDYLYGAPFLVPRATTRLTVESIEFAYRAGVRAYAAEAYPNWALDGPKLWVAAQVLWDPSRPVDGLLEDYYGHFWQEAALPMRRFYEGCEKAWREQPGPGWWIKYYQDEGQADLFPPSLCARLRSDLEKARAVARDPEVRARLELVSTGFAVTERFSAFCEARTALSRASAAAEVDRMGAVALLEDCRSNRTALAQAYERAVAAGGISRTNLDVYLRDDPAPGMEKRLRSAAEAPAQDAGLSDPDWKTLRSPEKLDDRTFGWSWTPWLGRGEPVEGRTILVSTDSAGRRVVSYRHCALERLQQWIAAAPGKAYEASVEVRGRISAGNATYLIMSWTDRQGRYTGRAVADRLPDGDWTGGKTLVATGPAPSDANKVGVAVYASHQTGDDFASFSGLSLKISEASIQSPAHGN